MSELRDIIIRDSHKRFRLRIDGFLRSKVFLKLYALKNL